MFVFALRVHITVFDYFIISLAGGRLVLQRLRGNLRVVNGEGKEKLVLPIISAHSTSINKALRNLNVSPRTGPINHRNRTMT